MNNCRLFIIFISVFFTSSLSLAQEKDLKLLVWEDCEQAVKYVQSLTVDQQQQAVTFLFDVVKLKIAEFEPNFSYKPDIAKAPTGGLLPQLSLAQSLSPDYHLAAKQCAVSLLPLMPANSKFILPELIKFSQDQTEDSLLRLRILESVLEISKTLDSCRTESTCSNDQLLTEVIATYLAAPSEIAAQIAVIFSAQSASILLGQIAQNKCDFTSCDEIKKKLDLFSLLDFKSSDFNSNNVKNSIAQLLVEALNEQAVMQDATALIAIPAELPNIAANLTPVISTVDQIASKVEPVQNKDTKLSLVLKTLRKIPLLYEELLTFLLSSLEQQLIFTKGISREQFFSMLDDIFSYESQNRSLVIDPNLRLKLFDQYQTANITERNIIQKGLVVLAGLGAEFENKIHILSVSKETDLRIRSAELARLVVSKSKKTEDILQKLIKDSELPVQVAAIVASANLEFLSKAKKTIEALALQLTKLLKSNGQDLGVGAGLTIKLLKSLKPEYLTKVYSTLAYDTLILVYQLQTLQHESADLLSYLSEHREFLLAKIKTAYKAKSKNQKLFDLYLIKSIEDLEFREQLSQNIIALLTDSDKEIAVNAEKMVLSWLQLPQVLVNSNKLNANLQFEFSVNLSGIVQPLSCYDYPAYIEICRQKQSYGAYCSMIFTDSHRCLGNLNFDTWHAADFDRLFKADPKLFRSLLSNNINQSAVKCETIRSALDSDLIINEDFPAICGLLKDLSCQELMPQVLLKKDLALSCYPAIKAAFDSAESGSISQAELFKSLVLIDSSGINLNTIFADALERRNAALIDMLINTNLTDGLIAIVKQSINTDSLDIPDLQFLIKYLEKLGPRAESLLPDLLSLSNRSELAYECRRAIIAIATNNPALRSSNLRKLIGSIGFPRLLREIDLNNLPETASLLVENNSNQLTYLEKRDLNTLLSRLSGETIVHQEAY